MRDADFSNTPITNVKAHANNPEPRRDLMLDTSTIWLGGRLYTSTEIKLRLQELNEFSENVSQQHEVVAQLLGAAQKELAAIKAACAQGRSQVDVAAEYVLFEAAADPTLNLKRNWNGDYEHPTTFHQFVGWLNARGATVALAAVCTPVSV